MATVEMGCSISLRLALWERHGLQSLAAAFLGQTSRASFISQATPVVGCIRLPEMALGGHHISQGGRLMCLGFNFKIDVRHY